MSVTRKKCEIIIWLLFIAWLCANFQKRFWLLALDWLICLPCGPSPPAQMDLINSDESADCLSQQSCMCFQSCSFEESYYTVGRSEVCPNPSHVDFMAAVCLSHSLDVNVFGLMAHQAFFVALHTECLLLCLFAHSSKSVKMANHINVSDGSPISLTFSNLSLRQDLFFLSSRIFWYLRQNPLAPVLPAFWAFCTAWSSIQFFGDSEIRKDYKSADQTIQLG